MRTPERLLITLAATVLWVLCNGQTTLTLDILAPKPDAAGTIVVKEPRMRLLGKVDGGEGKIRVMVGNGRNDIRTPATVGPDGRFMAELTLEPGSNRLLVVAMDARDMSTKQEVTVVLGELPVAAPAPVDVAKAEPPAPVKEQAVETPPAPVPAPAPSRTVAVSRDAAMENEEAPDVYALVVGVSRYERDPGITLRYASSDAKAYADLLRGATGGRLKEENLKLLRDGHATAENIRYWLRDLASKADEDDLLIFYFSGHGTNDGEGDLCLLAYDTRTTNKSSLWSTGVTQANILGALDASRCRKRLMILDACQSGLMAVGERAVDDPEVVYAEKLAQADGRLMILTSSSPGESSYESADLGGGRGIFTHYLLQGMSGEADGAAGAPKDGWVDLYELSVFLPPKVNAEAKAVSGKEQRPHCNCAGSESVPLSMVRASNGSTPAELTETRSTATTPPPPSETPAPLSTPRGYTYRTKPEDMKKLQDVLFKDEATGDKITFFTINGLWYTFSGHVAGESFHAQAPLQGKTFDFQVQDQPTTVKGGSLDMSVEWDMLDATITIPGRDPVKRRMRRIGVLERRPLSVGTIFGDAEQDQQLEVVEVNNVWYRLAGHLGSRIVNLRAQRIGDAMLLWDDDQGWQAKGILSLGDTWNSLSGHLDIKDEGSERFELKLAEAEVSRDLTDRTFTDLLNETQTITFFGQNREWVNFNGTIGDAKINVNARLVGDVVVFTDASGKRQINPGRLLLKDGGRRLVGEVDFIEPPIVVSVDLRRVN